MQPHGSGVPALDGAGQRRNRTPLENTLHRGANQGLQCAERAIAILAGRRGQQALCAVNQRGHVIASHHGRRVVQRPRFRPNSQRAAFQQAHDPLRPVHRRAIARYGECGPTQRPQTLLCAADGLQRMEGPT
jgi:hypothetical protein